MPLQSPDTIPGEISARFSYVENIMFVYAAIQTLERTEKSGQTDRQIDRQTDTLTKNNTLPQGLRSVIKAEMMAYKTRSQTYIPPSQNLGANYVKLCITVLANSNRCMSICISCYSETMH